ncbi:MAG: methyltransferase domain-containing protein [Actinomycetota bacterium]|nr:methyltransferase domain-containing protein [Actinomycetota bacterium]
MKRVKMHVNFRPTRISIKPGRPPMYPIKKTLAVIRGIIYHGKRVECPCCGKSFSLFLYSPYMTAPCPYCLSFERYRLLCKYLSDETDFGKKEMSVLDIAPTWCFQEFCRKFESLNYTSVDLSSPLADHHMDIRKLRFPDSTFDWVICYHVLEHVDDDRAALQEIRRVMKKGGLAVIQVPIHRKKTVYRFELSSEEAKEILKYPDHRRAYGRDFKDLLLSTGFDVSVVPFVKKFSEQEIKRFGLDKSEDLYICRKVDNSTERETDSP